MGTRRLHNGARVAVVAMLAAALLSVPVVRAEGHIQQVHLSWAAVQVDKTDLEPYPPVGLPVIQNVPGLDAEFAVHETTDSPQLASFMKAHGVPMGTEAMQYSSTVANDTAVVDSGAMAHRMVTNGQFTDAVTGIHSHYQQIWTGSGATAHEVVLKVHGARDSLCVARTDRNHECEGVVTSKAGSSIASFLGGTQVHDVLFGARHQKIPVVALYFGNGTHQGSNGGVQSQLPELPPTVYGGVLPWPDETAAPVYFEGCYFSVSAFATTLAHARHYVPSQYNIDASPEDDPYYSALQMAQGQTPTTGKKALLVMWDLACDLMNINS